MKYLLDTNILVWWLLGDKRLKQDVIDIISNPACVKFVSVASIWEIVIKNQTKKLNLVVTYKEIFKSFGFEILNIGIDHVLKVGMLPNIHKDPFDRMLVAQALVEDCVLLTTDKKVQKYFSE